LHIVSLKYNIIDSQREKEIEQQNEQCAKAYQEAKKKLNEINDRKAYNASNAIFLSGLQIESRKLKKEIDILQVKLSKLNKAKEMEEKNNKRMLYEYKMKVEKLRKEKEQLVKIDPELEELKEKLKEYTARLIEVTNKEESLNEDIDYKNIKEEIKQLELENESLLDQLNEDNNKHINNTTKENSNKVEEESPVCNAEDNKAPVHSIKAQVKDDSYKSKVFDNIQIAPNDLFE